MCVAEGIYVCVGYVFILFLMMCARVVGWGVHHVIVLSRDLGLCPPNITTVANELLMF